MPTIEQFSELELPEFKHHALRALCGLLMDRHSECTTCPLCGNSDDVLELIVNAIPNIDESGGSQVIALYFCRAEYDNKGKGDLNVLEDWGAGVWYADAQPVRKAVVQPVSDGTYIARYGQIANPTEGDYSSGRLDTSQPVIPYRCNPEPDWAQWRYWESGITKNQTAVPEFLCLRLRREWWILDRDMEQGMIQQVAALTVADNPDHLTDRTVLAEWLASR